MTEKNEKDTQDNSKTRPADITGETTEKPNSKRFYKKPKFWVLAILIIIAVAVSAFIFIYATAQAKNRQAIQRGWFEITSQSQAVVDKSQKIKDEKTFDEYKTELSKLDKIIVNKKNESTQLQLKAEDTQLYEIFLNDFGSYIQQANSYSIEIKKYSENDSDVLRDKSLIAKESADRLKSKANYLKDEMPSSIYDIGNTLLETNKLLLVSELSVKAKELAEQAQSAKDKSDLSSTELLANNYLTAFVSGNAAQLRQYMTEGFQKEYDFNQLTPAARENVFPSSFRILNNQKVEDGKYKSQANVLYKFRDGSGQYTVGNEINMIYDVNSARWLVNSVKEGTAF